MISMLFFKFIGIRRWRANPLPEPQGMMPKAVSEWTMERATSLMVPSPPTATTISTWLFLASVAISEACPALSVILISYSKSSLFNVDSIRLGMAALLLVPEIGFIMNTIFFFIQCNNFVIWSCKISKNPQKTGFYHIKKR